MEPLAVLAEDDDLPDWRLPDELARLYGGTLGLPEDCVVANFVESLDGVVAVPGLPRSHALIGDESEPDRFVMALLRACADVILIGSGTLLASPKGTWRADRVYPPAAGALNELRAARGLEEQPLVAIVTAGGSFDPTHPLLEQKALVLTTEHAAPDIRASVPAATEVAPVSAGDSVDVVAAVAELRRRGCAVILSESGPNVFGALLASQLVDELFLTLSPVLAGRAKPPRLGLVEGVELLPQVRVAGRLRSVRTHGSHLFLRYSLR